MKNLTAAAIALLILPVTGQAQTPLDTWVTNDFSSFCTFGSLRTACGSVVVRTLWDGTTTSVELRVRNEQGTLDQDNTGGSFITAVGLTAPTIEGASDLVVGVIGNVTVVGSAASFWNFDGPIGGQVEFSAANDNGLQGSIKGCDQPNGNPDNYFGTCEGTGDDGWVVFNFTTTNAWSAADAQVAIKYQSIDASPDDNDLSLQCRTGDDGEHFCAVVPEPETYALLGTGLLALGAIVFIRRRKQGLDLS